MGYTHHDGISVNNLVVNTSATVPQTPSNPTDIPSKNYVDTRTWIVDMNLLAASVAQWIWIAPRACRVVSVKEVHSVVGGAAATVRPRKITDTSAPGAVASGTVKELTQAAFDLTAVINTTQAGTLSATQADYTFAAGDKLALNLAGTLTGLVGYIAIEFQSI